MSESDAERRIRALEMGEKHLREALRLLVEQLAAAEQRLNAVAGK